MSGPFQLGRAEAYPMPTREVVATEKAPKAIGPYSQGVKAGDFIFTAGQAPIDPVTGKLVEGDIAEQTRRVLKNIQAILEAADSSLERVVKTTVLLNDMIDFQAMNAVYAEFFPPDKNPPARTTAQAKLPLGALVVMDAVALII